MDQDLWQRYTITVVQVLRFAQAEATRQGVRVVGTEHLLVGLVQEQTGAAAHVLGQFGVNIERVRSVLTLDPLPPEAVTNDAEKLSLSPLAKNALHNAQQEFQCLFQQYRRQSAIDTEHILLGLLHVGAACNGSILLQRMDVDLEQLARAVICALPYREPVPGRLARLLGGTRRQLLSLGYRIKPLPVATSAVPVPNAFDDFRAAGDALVDRDGILAFKLTAGEPVDAHQDERKTLLQQNATALAKVREGFAHAYQYPNITDFFGTFPLLKEMRLFLYLFAFEGRQFAAGGDFVGAMQSYLDAIRLGITFPRGGMLITHQIGQSFERICHRQLRPIIHHLGAEHTQCAISALETQEAQRTSLTESMLVEASAHLHLIDTLITKTDQPPLQIPTDLPERDLLLKLIASSPYQQQAVRHHVYRMYQRACARVALPYTSAPFACPKTSDKIVDEMISFFIAENLVATQQSDAETRIAAAFSLLYLALQAYALRYATFPARLADLVPRHLSKIPLDPFTMNRAIRYHRVGWDAGIIYSIGPDGDAPAKYQLTIRMPKAGDEAKS